MSALGRELQLHGHQVTFLQIPDLELKVRSEGLSFYPIGESSYQPSTMAQTFMQFVKLSELNALEYSVKFCQELAEMICRDTPKAIAKLGINFLLIDQLEIVGETVAKGLRMPFICISSGQAIHR